MDARRQVTFVGHRREVDDRGGAAPDGAQGMVGRSGVGRAVDQLAGAGLHVGRGVGVGFDAAGDHYLSRHVHDCGVLFRQHPRQGHGHDLLPLDADVP